MPNYEYLCTKCGHTFEEIRKFSDKHPKKCPECGGVLELVISAPAVQFKGSGFYVTDYSKKGTSSASSSAENESSAKEAKEKNDAKDTKKDDKPKSETSSKKHKKD